MEEVQRQDWDQVVDTGINLVNLKKFAKQIVNIPEGLTMQRQVALMIKQRTKMGLGDLPLNWGMAELLRIIHYLILVTK